MTTHTSLSRALALAGALSIMITSACAPISSPAGRDEGGAGVDARAASAPARGATATMSHADESRASERAKSAPSEGSATPKSGAGGASFAVVELFTSEGCSSCPPADDVLRALADEARADGRPVFLLSFHVDYWNDLGWPDPFSAPAFTDRQRAYARAARASGVYTPEMIVGGRGGFVGSDAAQARSRIEQSLSERALAAVSLKARAPQGGSHIDVTYAVTGAPEDTVLNLALIERDLVVRVPRGENAGRTLRHENVVRAFDAAPASSAPEGSVKLPLPPSLDRSKASIVAYVQRRASLEIIGAASTIIE